MYELSLHPGFRCYPVRFLLSRARAGLRSCLSFLLPGKRSLRSPYAAEDVLVNGEVSFNGSTASTVGYTVDRVTVAHTVCESMTKKSGLDMDFKIGLVMFGAVRADARSRCVSGV